MAVIVGALGKVILGPNRRLFGCFLCIEHYFCTFVAEISEFNFDEKFLGLMSMWRFVHIVNGVCTRQAC